MIYLELILQVHLPVEYYIVMDPPKKEGLFTYLTDFFKILVVSDSKKAQPTPVGSTTPTREQSLDRDKEPSTSSGVLLPNYDHASTCRLIQHDLRAFCDLCDKSESLSYISYDSGSLVDVSNRDLDNDMDLNLEKRRESEPCSRCNKDDHLRSSRARTRVDRSRLPIRSSSDREFAKSASPRVRDPVKGSKGDHHCCCSSERSVKNTHHHPAECGERKEAERHRSRERQEKKSHSARRTSIPRPVGHDRDTTDKAAPSTSAGKTDLRTSKVHTSRSAREHTKKIPHNFKSTGTQVSKMFLQQACDTETANSKRETDVEKPADVERCRNQPQEPQRRSKVLEEPERQPRGRRADREKSEKRPIIQVDTSGILILPSEFDEASSRKMEDWCSPLPMEYVEQQKEICSRNTSRPVSQRERSFTTATYINQIPHPTLEHQKERSFANSNQRSRAVSPHQNERSSTTATKIHVPTRQTSEHHHRERSYTRTANANQRSRAVSPQQNERSSTNAADVNLLARQTSEHQNERSCKMCANNNHRSRLVSPHQVERTSRTTANTNQRSRAVSPHQNERSSTNATDVNLPARQTSEHQNDRSCKTCANNNHRSRPVSPHQVERSSTTANANQRSRAVSPHQNERSSTNATDVNLPARQTSEHQNDRSCKTCANNNHRSRPVSPHHAERSSTTANANQRSRAVSPHQNERSPTNTTNVNLQQSCDHKKERSSTTCRSTNQRSRAVAPQQAERFFAPDSNMNLLARKMYEHQKEISTTTNTNHQSKGDSPPQIRRSLATTSNINLLAQEIAEEQKEYSNNNQRPHHSSRHRRRHSRMNAQKSFVEAEKKSSIIRVYTKDDHILRFHSDFTAVDEPPVVKRTPFRVFRTSPCFLVDSDSDHEPSPPGTSKGSVNTTSTSNTFCRMKESLEEKVAPPQNISQSSSRSKPPSSTVLPSTSRPTTPSVTLSTSRTPLGYPSTSTADGPLLFTMDKSVPSPSKNPFPDAKASKSRAHMSALLYSPRKPITRTRIITPRSYDMAELPSTSQTNNSSPQTGTCVELPTFTESTESDMRSVSRRDSKGTIFFTDTSRSNLQLRRTSTHGSLNRSQSSFLTTIDEEKISIYSTMTTSKPSLTPTEVCMARYDELDSAATLAKEKRKRQLMNNEFPLDDVELKLLNECAATQGGHVEPQYIDESTWQENKFYEESDSEISEDESRRVRR